MMIQYTTSQLYQESGVYDPAILPDAVGEAYWLTDARIGLRATDDRYGIAMFANN